MSKSLKMAAGNGNQDHSVVTISQGVQGRVVITPLTSTARFHTQGPNPAFGQLLHGSQPTANINRVLLKAVQKDGGKSKMFTIRNIGTNIHSCDDLKTLIRNQLSGDIITDDFDVGFLDGSNTIRIRTKEDLAEVRSELLKQRKVTLRCDGLAIQGKNTGPPQKRIKDGDVDESKACKKKQLDREGKVQKAVDSLKEKHASLYTVMQMRIWAEMIVSGMYSDMDEPPNTSMFIRAGGGKNPSSNKQSLVTQAITDAATALTNVLSPKQTPSSDSNKVSSSSPAKVIENRSILYKQLNELRELYKGGILTEDEYKSEKGSIMELLRNLSMQ